MRVVPDTNTLISAIFWHGAPRLFLDRARQSEFELCTTVPLIQEFEDVLHRPTFAGRLMRLNATPTALTDALAAWVTVVQPAHIPPVVLADPDDDALFACAVAAHAKVVVSGDRHVLQIRTYRGITIMPVHELLRRGARQ